MADDRHLGTGEYDPEKYWDARAEASKGDVYQAVCVFGHSDAENAAAEKVQLAMLSSVLRSVQLSNKKVMELGCGVGRLAPWFVKKGARYTGTDISGRMIEIAKSRNIEGEFYTLRSDELPFPSAHFDMTCSVTALHHNPYERQTKIIKEMLRVTKTGGLILLLEGMKSRVHEAVSFNMFPRTIDDWIMTVQADCRARIIRMKVARLWLLRDAVFGVVRVLWRYRRENGAPRGSLSALPGVRAKIISGLDRCLIRIGSKVDVPIMSLLPKKYGTTVVMLFEKLVPGGDCAKN